MKHARNIIYDFETLSQEVNGAVTCCALLIFHEKRFDVNNDPYTFEELVDSAKVIKLDVEDQVKNYKRIITQETLDWWKSQGSEAQKWITPSDDDQKISKLYDWFWENSPTDIKNFYTRGKTCDPIFLQSLMADTDRPMPYNWWQIRDTRSYIEGLAWGSELIHDYIPPGCEGFTKHDPKHDIALDVMRMQTIARAIV